MTPELFLKLLEERLYGQPKRSRQIKVAQIQSQILLKDFVILEEESQSRSMWRVQIVELLQVKDSKFERLKWESLKRSLSSIGL